MTLGANSICLEKYNLQGKVIKINKAAVICARNTVNDRALVALSISSTGELLIPFGNLTFEGMKTLMGNPPESCAISADKMGIAALGINCSGGPDELLLILKSMRKYTSLPIIVQPNVGIPQLVDGITIFPLMQIL